MVNTLDPKNLTESLNKIRLDNLNKEFSSYEIKSLLTKNNIPAGIVYSLVKVGGIEYKGNRKVRKYIFPNDPIFITKVNKAIYCYKDNLRKNKIKKSKITIEEAIELLKKNNYKIQKPKQLNFNKLKDELGDKIFDYIDYEIC